SHFKVALRVLRYLKGSPGCGVQFYRNQDLKLKAYADADWAKCPKTRKSVTGFCTKHFELDVHFVREKVLAGVIKTVKVSSNLQTANVFTKCLGVVQHKLCCKNLGLLDFFAGELVGKVLWRKAQAPKKKVKKD
ncbi:hypothetical protein Tco_1324134, partial [Tanacetum coccineum]